MKHIKLHLSKLLVVMGLLCTVLGFQNCSKVGYTIDPVAKQAAIANASVFGDQVVPQADIDNNDNESDSVIDNNDNQEDDQANNDDEPDTSGSKISISPMRVCGPDVAVGSQASLPTAAKVVAVLFDVSDIWVGEKAKVIQSWDQEADTSKLKTVLTEGKPFELALKASLSAGREYTVVFYDAAKVKAPYSYSWQNGADAIAPLQDSVTHFLDSRAVFSVDKAGIQKKPLEVNLLVGVRGEPQCKDAGVIDPLIIQLKTAVPQPIVLTSAEKGVMFDLMGQRNHHVPVKTAWFASSVAENYFLVLPNGQGKVLGIDELFGDATMGPDKKFAKQGFAALAKWDENKDKVISFEDAVFTQLRLWKDENLDGIAQASELHTLEEKEVVAIDLRYDRRYKEVDQHGNMTKYKSIVVMKDSSFGLAFDLYLTYVSK